MKKFETTWTPCKMSEFYEVCDNLQLICERKEEDYLEQVYGTHAGNPMYMRQVCKRHIDGLGMITAPAFFKLYTHTI